MGNFKINFNSIKDKNSLFRVVLISAIAIGIAVRLSNRKQPSPAAAKIIKIEGDRFGNFDKVNIPNRSPVIARMISVLKPTYNINERHAVAEKIHQALTKYEIPPQIVVAIIDTESSFKQDAVSTTGDLSMAQVNAEIWNKEFLRMNIDQIDIERLKTDDLYSLEVMAKILQILKTRHGKSDRRWYARYHSKSEKNKIAYLRKLDKRMKKLEHANLYLRKSLPSRLVALQ